eukprot:Rmarinus@m.3133
MADCESRPRLSSGDNDVKRPSALIEFARGSVVSLEPSSAQAPQTHQAHLAQPQSCVDSPISSSSQVDLGAQRVEGDDSVADADSNALLTPRAAEDKVSERAGETPSPSPSGPVRKVAPREPSIGVRVDADHVNGGDPDPKSPSYRDFNFDQKWGWGAERVESQIHRSDSGITLYEPSTPSLRRAESKIDEAMQFALGGGFLLKRTHNGKGRPHSRFCRFVARDLSFHWGKNAADTKMASVYVSYVLSGLSVTHLNSKHAEEDALCFSLAVSEDEEGSRRKESDRTLHFIAKTSQERDRWVLAIRSALENVKRQSSPQHSQV